MELFQQHILYVCGMVKYTDQQGALIGECVALQMYVADNIQTL